MNIECQSADLEHHAGALWLVGMPVHHSLSPVFQNAGLASVGLERWCYTLRPTKRSELDAVVQALEAGVCAGANVTVPYKEDFVPLVRQLGADAAIVGAVNTLVPDEHGVTGYNTDVYGFRQLVSQWRAGPLAIEEALVLGAGGSARAVVLALAQLGARSVVVANRTPERAHHLMKSLSKSMKGRYKTVLSAVALSDVDERPAPDLLVHCTSLGVGASEGSAAFEEAISYWQQRLPWARWRHEQPHGGVLDICYSQTQTPLVALARQWELAAVDGLDMLLYQGVRSFELWTGREAPVERMRSALYGAVRHREEV